MSSEAISDNVLIREFTRELHNKNAAVFAGAGLSMASGYADWKGLLKDIIGDLGLDPDVEDDLVTIAQYHCNQAGGNRARLTQTIFNHFAQTKHPTVNHKLLARLPIHTYWTTNYDKLIEMALSEAKKTPDIKYTLKQLSVTRPDRDVVVYKMHGDIDHPSDAVISKDDYESYPFKMAPFVSALRGDLIEKTFLFLGFSFSDPNIDYVLSRVRAQYEEHQRHHYCIQRSVSRLPNETEETFKYRELKQHYFIRDLKRFGIQTVLVRDYGHITNLLDRISDCYKRSSVFISGAADDYGKLSPNGAQALMYELSKTIASEKNRIITGFGLGVGGAIINGALAHLNDVGKTISDEHIVMRPFPQIASHGARLADEWRAYRKAMIEHAGIVVFVYGNKRDPTGNLVESNGMREEFDLCIESGVCPLPIGATGYLAETLWNEVLSDFKTYYPDATQGFRDQFEKLGDHSLAPPELIAIVKELIKQIQRG